MADEEGVQFLVTVSQLDLLETLKGRKIDAKVEERLGLDV